MLEDWVFMTAVLMGSLLFIFHGCVLLLAPGRYLPLYSLGQTELKFARKPPLELGKRVLGLCFSTAILWLFTRPAILWMLHPTAVKISSGNSASPHGIARWGLLALSIFLVLCSYYLMTQPEKSVELLFAADKSKLKDKSTLRLWTIYVQLGGFFSIVWALFSLSDFIKSLR